MHVDLLQRAKLSILKWWAGSTGRKAVARALWGQLTDIWLCSQPQLVLDRSSREGRTGWVLRSQPWAICPEEQGGERCPQSGLGMWEKDPEREWPGLSQGTVDK